MYICDASSNSTLNSYHSPTQRHIPDRNDHSSPYQLDAVEGALAEAEAQKTKLHRVGIEVLAHLIDTP